MPAAKNPGGNAGKGRRKGTPNKVSAALKDMILGALHAEGGQRYFQEQARANPVAFLALLGRVLPTTLAGDPTAPLALTRIELIGISPPGAGWRQRAAAVAGAAVSLAKADGFYQSNDWQTQTNGENYLDLLRQGGRPHVQRAAAELLATLGPRIAQLEDHFANNYGWSANPATRISTRLGFETLTQEVVPNPARP